MPHTSHTFSTPVKNTVFTDDTIVFFGFPSGPDCIADTERFEKMCDENGTVYSELSFSPSFLWHYCKCYEIAVHSFGELESIVPIIERFGELNGYAAPDETVIVLRPRREIEKLHAMFTVAAIEKENIKEL